MQFQPFKALFLLHLAPALILKIAIFGRKLCLGDLCLTTNRITSEDSYRLLGGALYIGM